MPSRRIFKERILREAQVQAAGTVVNLTPAFAALAATTPLAANDRLPILTSAGLARYVLGSTARTYVLGIAAGIATIPEGLTVQGAVTLNPANANVSVAPSGTGSVTINPAVAGSINAMSLGQTIANRVTGTILAHPETLSGTETIAAGVNAGFFVTLDLSGTLDIDGTAVILD